MSLNKWKKSIKNVFMCENCVIRKTLQSKNHLKIYVFLPSGKKRMFVTCITPSDSKKALLNFRGDVRRAIKENT